MMTDYGPGRFHLRPVAYVFMSCIMDIMLVTPPIAANTLLYQLCAIKIGLQEDLYYNIECI